MNLSERQLENMIYSDASTNKGRANLESRGLWIRGTLFRQLRMGYYGIADLVSIFSDNFGGERNTFIDIYELKKGIISSQTVTQGIKYREGILKWLENIEGLGEIHINLYLLGSSLENTSELTTLISSLNYKTSLHVGVILYQLKKGELYFEIQNPKCLGTSQEINSTKTNMMLKSIARYDLLFTNQ